MKLFDDFFGPEDNQRDEEVPERRPEVDNTHQAAPEGPGVARGVLPSSEASHTASSPYKFPNIPKTLGVTLDREFHRRKPL